MTSEQHHRFDTTRRRAATLVAIVGLTLAAALWVWPGSASATNAGSKSGDNTTGCAVDWNAETVLDTDLNNTQDGGGLAVGLDGQPEDYSNGGYMTLVRPEVGNGPGIFELTHWYSNTTSPSAAGVGEYWRLPIATDHTILNATVTVTLPANVIPSTVTLDGTTDAPLIPTWGTPYSDYTWSPIPGDAADGSGTSWTFHLGTLTGGTGEALRLVSTVVTGTMLTDPVYATAALTGTYIQGDAPGCTPTAPALPTVPSVGSCGLGLAGQTLFPLDASDITTRTKLGTGGETNADGWVTAPNRTFRLYGAVERDVTGVTYTATAAQGFTFQSGSAGSVVTANPVGMGALYGNGYTVAATGIGIPTISADGKTVTLTVANMPANSAFAFTVTAVPDGSGEQLAVNHTLAADLVTCPSPSPTPSTSTPSTSSSSSTAPPSSSSAASSAPTSASSSSSAGALATTAANSFPPPPAGPLASTGAPVTTPIVAGLVAVLVGASLLLLARRRTPLTKRRH